MKKIIYTITFFSEWHCGSGLTSGSDSDELVIKDNDGFPMIPGKTLKGLLKEAAFNLYGNDFVKQKNSLDDNKFIPRVFGYFDNKNIEESEINVKGEAFFSNATISKEVRKHLKNENLVSYFYRDYSSTQIDDNGIATKHSLRTIQTTIPCRLIAEIYNVDEKYEYMLDDCMKWIKQMGLNRNRGLGRCKFEIINKEGKEEMK